MKKLIATMAVAVLAIAGSAVAEEVKYVAIMKGVTWGGCKKTVSSAFTSAGGSNVTIESNKAKAGTQKVTITSDKEISAFDAIKALGKSGSKYVVLTWGAAEEEG